MGIAKSELYPTLFVLATGKSYNSPPLLYNTFVVQDIGLFTAAVHLDYTLADFGARRSEITEAQAKLVAANLTFNDAHLQLIQQVSEAYYALLNASGLRAAAEVNLSDAKALEEAAQERRNNGLATLPDLLESSAEREQANYDLQSAIGVEKTAFGNLATIITARPTRPFRLQELNDLHIPHALDQSLEDAIESAFQERPDLLAERAKLKAAHAEVTHAISAYFPMLSLEGEGGWVRAWGQQNPYPGTYAQPEPTTPVFSSNGPIFDGWRRENRVSQAKAEEAAAKNAVHEREDQIWSTRSRCHREACFWFARRAAHPQLGETRVALSSTHPHHRSPSFGSASWAGRECCGPVRSAMSRPLQAFPAINRAANVVRAELAMYPGRLSLTLRIMLACTSVMVLVMVLRIPAAALGAYYPLLLSRDSPRATRRSALRTAIACTLGAVEIIIGAMLFAGSPFLHFFWLMASLFAVFFLISAMQLYDAAVALGVLIASATTIWDMGASPATRVTLTLYTLLSILMGCLISALIETLFAQARPQDAALDGIQQRLALAEKLLRKGGDRCRRRLNQSSAGRYAARGTGDIREFVAHSSYDSSYRAQLATVIVLSGQLIELSVNLEETIRLLSPTDVARCNAIAQKIAGIRLRIAQKEAPDWLDRCDENEYSNPTLAENERNVEQIAESFSDDDPTPHHHLAEPGEQQKTGVFQNDAFSSPEHLKFAIRGTLNAMTCYLFYMSVGWTFLAGSVTTCILTKHRSNLELGTSYVQLSPDAFMGRPETSGTEKVTIKAQGPYKARHKSTSQCAAPHISAGLPSRLLAWKQSSHESSNPAISVSYSIVPTLLSMGTWLCGIHFNVRPCGLVNI